MAVKCYYVTPITLTLIPTVRAIAVHGSATIDGRREKRHRSYPLQNARGWHPPNGRPVPGRCHRPPRPSSLPAPGTPSRSRPPTLPPSSSSRPAPSLVHPALSSGPDHRTPHPRQEFREPLLAAPPSHPTATTTPTTSAALTPRGTRCRRTTGCGRLSPRRCRPRRPGREGV